MQIFSNGKDLSVVMPGQGTFILKQCVPTDFRLNMNQPYIDYSTIDTIYRIPGLRSINIDLSFQATEFEQSDDWTPINMTDQYTILELFKIIEKRIDKRSK
jgi:hypothetical protein